jgi:hypothetical protein
MASSAETGAGGSELGGLGSTISFRFELMCAATSCTRQPAQALGANQSSPLMAANVSTKSCSDRVAPSKPARDTATPCSSEPSGLEYLAEHNHKGLHSAQGCCFRPVPGTDPPRPSGKPRAAAQASRPRTVVEHRIDEPGQGP